MLPSDQLKSSHRQQSTLIRAGSRRYEVFVFRVHNDIEDDQIKQFLTNEDAKVRELEPVSQMDAWTKSYRVAVETNDLDVMCHPEFWPDGIGCRRYWSKKTQ